MLTVKRAIELLLPYAQHPDWLVLRLDTHYGRVTVRPDKLDHQIEAETVRDVIEIAASVWGVAPEEITSRRRPMDYVKPRMAVAKLLLDVLGMSDRKASGYLGRVRTAITHSTKQANRMLDTDQDYRTLYRRFELQVRECLEKSVDRKEP